VTIPVGTGLHPNPSGITSGDWDGDGKIDLAVVNSGSHSLTLLFGDGTGAFPAVQSASLPEGGSPRYVVTGDFNGDTYPDLAVSNRDNHTVSILLNNHDGTFSAPIVRSVGQGPLAMAVGRLNGDNLDDLAVVNSRDNTISVFLQFP
jgi:hypothetical protein